MFPRPETFREGWRGTLKDVAGFLSASRLLELGSAPTIRDGALADSSLITSMSGILGGCVVGESRITR